MFTNEAHSGQMVFMKEVGGVLFRGEDKQPLIVKTHPTQLPVTGAHSLVDAVPLHNPSCSQHVGPLKVGANGGTRTRNLNVGNVAHYHCATLAFGGICIPPQPGGYLLLLVEGNVPIEVISPSVRNRTLAYTNSYCW